jgi:O-antigen/teichoic acid export membrane protein
MTLTTPRPSITAVRGQTDKTPRGRHRMSRRQQWFASHPAWPLAALLAGYPVWWVFGLADESVFIMAVPMLMQMRSWHRRGRSVNVPPAFGLWLLFLVCVGAGIVTLGLSAPDTVVSSLSNRALSYADRGVTYGALTVILLYAGNLTEDELPRRRLAWLLGLVGIYATIGGLGGVADSHFQFKSPLAYVVPHGMQSNTLIQAALYPGFSQVTGVLGVTEGRPKAPFEYTNTWGECLTFLLPWLLVAWWSYGSRKQRKWVLLTAAGALIPLVYSLNRTVWAGIGLTALYLAVRLAARGKLAMLGLVCAGLALVGVAVVTTPLQGLITSRLQHQQSNSIRGSLSVTALQDANAAPVIGYGDTRHQQGSASSIAVGPTSNCPSCGQYTVGSNGQLYLLLICNGWVGTAFFLSFFGYLGWRYRRDKTPYGTAGMLVILLSFLYMFAYTAVTAPLEFIMISVALLWRNDQWLRHGDRALNSGGRPGLASVPRRVAPRRAAASTSWETSTPWRPALAPAHPSATAVMQPMRPRAAVPAGRPQLDSPTERRTDGRLAEVARGSLLNLVGAAVAGLGTVALTVIIARMFSKAAAGAFFTAMSLFLIVEAVASLGAATGTVYFIARLRALGQHQRIPEVMRTAIRPVAVVSVTVAVILFLLADPVARLLVDGQLGHAGATPVVVTGELRALAIALPFAVMLDVLLGASRGYRVMGPTVMVDKIGRPGLQLAGIGVAAFAGSAALLAPLWALPYVPAACLVWLWFRRIRRQPPPVTGGTSTGSGPPPAESADGQAPLHFWRFTGPRGLAALAQITIQRIDIVLVAILRGPAEAAIYTAATRFLVAGQFGNQAISMAAQPRFTEMFTQGDRPAANRVYQATTAWLIVLTWPLYLLAVLFGPEVLTVFGHSYRQGASVVVILGLTMLFQTACGQVDMVLVTAGRSSWSLANGLLAVGVNVGLDVLLIPRYGITGAAIGWSAAIVVANLVPLVQLAMTVRLHPFGRGTCIAAVLSALSFGALPVAARELLGHGAIPSLAAVACGCAVMAVGLFRFRADLQLATMPGGAQLVGAARRRKQAAGQEPRESMPN